MHGDLELGIQLREEIMAERLLGPRIVAAGRVVRGPKPAHGTIAAANEAEGRQVVNSLKERGADFVKVLWVPRNAYFAIADEAKKQGIPFAGHVPDAVTAMEASDAGQRSIEHLSGILLSCSTREEELRNEMIEAIMKPEQSISERRARRLTTAKALDTFSEQKASVLFAHLAKNCTWQVPTLTMKRAFAFKNDEGFTDDARLKYIPRFMRDWWKKSHARKLTAEEDAERKMVFRKALELVGAMHQAGVPFMAGADAPMPYVFPGFSLHDELALLVQAGFTPMEALQTATRNPAEFLGKLDELGTIEEAKLADLVLLDANPLQDIRNTQRIAGVVVAGKYLPRSELDKMLAQVEAAARSR
jgi:imidazolonepropionase-like amidohydrolase